MIGKYHKYQEVLTKKGDLETILEEKNKILFNHQEEIRDDLRIIEKYI